MNERAQDIAEALASIDEAIADVKDVMSDPGSASMHQMALDAKVDLLAERLALVEELESIGLEDPAL